jgi:hypothetical protein
MRKMGIIRTPKACMRMGGQVIMKLTRGEAGFFR